MPGNTGGTDGNPDTTGQLPGVVTPTQTLPVEASFEPTAQQTLDYMRYIGPSLIGRVLTDEEEMKLSASAGDAVKPSIETWVKDDGVVEAVKSMLEIRLGSNGKRGTVDFNPPGYIATSRRTAYLAHFRPWPPMPAWCPPPVKPSCWCA
jgi:hypothetical protein